MIMRVAGYSLGADGSTLYRTGTNDFFLHPSLVGWFLERHELIDDVFEYAEHWFLRNRGDAIAIIEQATA